MRSLLVVFFIFVTFLGGCGGDAGGAPHAVPKFVMTIETVVPFQNFSTLGDVGGNGASCNPNEPAYPGCTLAPVRVASSGRIERIVEIPLRNYTTPFRATIPNTEYRLVEDVSARGTAFVIEANYVHLNLNGHRVIYNQENPGEGVTIGRYNLHDIAVTNGSILQGAAQSEGNLYGQGNNPVSSFNTELGGNRSVNFFQAANLYVRYGGRDVGGIVVSGDDGLYEENTIEDLYRFGTLKNRHQGVDALTGSKNVTNFRNVYRNNTIINCRHRGISTGNSAEAVGNRVEIRSIATNSIGISQYKGKNIKVYNNTIIGRGEHPIGIGFGSEGTDDIEIHHNLIDVQVTALGEEYSSQYNADKNAVVTGNEAVGFRSTWGGNNIRFHHNVVTVRSDSHVVGTYSPTGETAHIRSNARGIMMMLLEGEYALFERNVISALDRDGTMEAKGIVVAGYDYDNRGDNAGLVFRGNWVRSNVMNVALGDSYGASPGWPLFIQNTFEKVGDFSSYATIGTGFGGYSRGSGRFVSNEYRNGAAESSLKMHFGNHNNETHPWKSIMFGRLMRSSISEPSLVRGKYLRLHSDAGDRRTATYVYPDGVTSRTVETFTNGQLPLPGSLMNDRTAFDDSGVVEFIAYDYELNDIGTQNGSTTVNRIEFAPHRIELSTLLTIPTDRTVTSWDAPASIGTFTYSWDGGRGSW